MYYKDPYKTEDQLLIKKREGVGLEHYNGSKAFIEKPNHMDNISENTKEY